MNIFARGCSSIVKYVAKKMSSSKCISINTKNLHINSDIHQDKRSIYQTTTTSLYKTGFLRLADNKAAENKYEHFAEPTELLNVKSENYRDSLHDFFEIHDEVINFGSPETADMMSGAVYFHASTSEDKCSQSLRIAMEIIPRLSVHELLICLSRMNWWGSEAGHSLALMEIVRALDRACVDRLQSQHFSLRDQLRLVHQWQSLLFLDNYSASFPTKMLTSVPASSLRQASLPLIISWLLLLSSTDPVPGDQADNEMLSEDINNILRSGGELGLRLLSESEVVACYLGLRALAPGSEKRIASFLKSQYGYRVHET